MFALWLQAPVLSMLLPRTAVPEEVLTES